MNERLVEILKGRAQPLDRAILADDLGNFDYPYVIKLDGKLADDPAAYILANYGAAVQWRRAEPHRDGAYIFRLVGFYEQQGTSATLWAFCVDRATASPLPGTAMIRWWPDARELPEIPPPASAWLPNGVVAYVKEDGAADWGVGHGEAYFPDLESGVCKVWPCSLDGPGDLLEGWGWLDGTQYRQLSPIFERVLVEEDSLEPEPLDLTAVVEAILQVAQVIDRPRTLT